MFFLLTLFFLATGSRLDAAPTDLHLRERFDNLPPSTCACYNQRSIWDIVWGCMTTIFACTWIAVHPNMSALGARGWRSALSQRMTLMVWTILAPEMTLFWAVKQWLGARKLEQEFREQGWTKTHGYFIQMGGFILYDGRLNLGILSLERFRALLRSGQIAFPEVTEEEIHARSKGDALSKTLVIAQTTWFIAQVIARLVGELMITELELATLAFATLNGFMYYFWWDKPLDAQLPVVVHLTHPTPSTSTTPDLSLNKDFSYVASANDVKEVDENVTSSVTTKTTRRSLRTIIIQCVTFPVRKVSAAYHWVDIQLGSMSPLSDFHIRDGQTHLPIFYAHQIPVEESRPITAVISFIGVVFGAIHCVGWKFALPSRVESVLWQASSLCITIVPFAALIMATSSFYPGVVGLTNSHWDFVEKVLGPFLLLGIIPLYVISRILLIVEAFSALRDLPSSAQRVVHWTSFMPHV